MYYNKLNRTFACGACGARTHDPRPDKPVFQPAELMHHKIRILEYPVGVTPNTSFPDRHFRRKSIHIFAVRYEPIQRCIWDSNPWPPA